MRALLSWWPAFAMVIWLNVIDRAVGPSAAFSAAITGLAVALIAGLDAGSESGPAAEAADVTGEGV